MHYLSSSKRDTNSLSLYIAHGVSENTAQNKIFIYEPYLVSQLIDLISPEKNIDLVK